MTCQYHMLYEKVIQMELSVRNEYAYLYFNSSFEIDIIVIMFYFNRETLFNHSICQDVFILDKYL